MTLRPRLSPGVPLSRDGKQELGVGTGDVNDGSGAKRAMCASVLTADELRRPTPSGTPVRAHRPTAPSRHVQPHVARQALHALRVPLEHTHPVPGQARPLPEEVR